MRVGWIVSGGGYTLRKVHSLAPELICHVVADRDCGALNFASTLPGVQWGRMEYSRLAWYLDSVALTCDVWVTLYDRLLTPEMIKAVDAPIINLHPSLLPAFPGLHAVRQAMKHGVKVTGATVHVVDEGMDTGRILRQGPVMVESTEKETAERVLDVGALLLVHALEEKLWLSQ